MEREVPPVAPKRPPGCPFVQGPTGRTHNQPPNTSVNERPAVGGSGQQLTPNIFFTIYTPTAMAVGFRGKGFQLAQFTQLDRTPVAPNT